MFRPSEGMRRLGIAVGVVAVMSWVAAMSWILFTMVRDKADLSPRVWGLFLMSVIVIGVPTFFLLGLLVIRGIDWVVAGFRHEKKS